MITNLASLVHCIIALLGGLSTHALSCCSNLLLHHLVVKRSKSKPRQRFSEIRLVALYFSWHFCQRWMLIVKSEQRVVLFVQLLMHAWFTSIRKCLHIIVLYWIGLPEVTIHLTTGYILTMAVQIKPAVLDFNHTIVLLSEQTNKQRYFYHAESSQWCI